MKNAVNRDIPEFIPGIGHIKPYQGQFTTKADGYRHGTKIRQNIPGKEKVLPTLEQAIHAVGLQDGMTISFHHHFRNGDTLMLQVVEAIARKGIRGLTLAASSLSAVQDVLLPYFEQGVITNIDTSGAREGIGKFITAGHLEKPAVFRSHGGRARAIESGELKIDVAFIGAPACDRFGNICGTVGKSACGSLGYAMVDAGYADNVIAITDNLSPLPVYPVSIPQTQVDYVVAVDNIGDPQGIATGSLRIRQDPRGFLLGQYVADVIEQSGYLYDGFSFQMGSGGASLAAAKFIREKMLSQKIRASFGVGGISATFVDMLEQGLVEVLYDVQDFDMVGIDSLRKNLNHIEISASSYANPNNCSPMVNNLDVVILSATEVDCQFNVNVLTTSDGFLLGAPGGHPDTAAGAKLTVVVLPLLRGRLPMIVNNVQTVVTPGETVDVVVTDYGIAINPQRHDLVDRLNKKSLPLCSIEELQHKAYKMTGEAVVTPVGDKICGLVEYRDGTIIDVIRNPLW